MKYFLLTLILLLAFSCKEEDNTTEVTDKVCIPSSLEDNLIAYYPFSNSSIEDFKSDNDLTNENNAEPTEGREGGENCAYKFNSESSNYLFLNTPTFLNNLRKYSISVWYKHTKRNDGKFEILVARGDKTNLYPSSNRIMSLGVYDGDMVTFFNNLHHTRDNPNEYNLDQWYHIVATCDFDTKTMNLYRDGILMDTETSITQEIVNPNDSGDLIIGKYINGSIDDIAIFNKVLSQDEVKELYSIESCCD